jgi:nicotinate (nicotinamide) nucleotide adenylyltransferase
VKVGIFSGTFDPVHAGHIAFALDAIKKAKLNEVYFLPEQQPRRKDGVTHYAHRMAMLKLALKPYRNLKLLDLPDRQFSVSKTLPRLQKQFKNDSLYMLLGSDMVDLLISPAAAEQWPDMHRLLQSVTLIVAVRGKRIKEEHRQKVNMLQPNAVVFASHRPLISSRDIRSALMKGKSHREILPSINSYIKAHWLYVSVAASPPTNNS